MADGIDGEQTFYPRPAAKAHSSVIIAAEVRGARNPNLQFERVEAVGAGAQNGALELPSWGSEPF